MNKPDFRMEGRVALVTGAGRGIGLGIAQAFASVGAAVAIQDIDEDVAQEVAAAIENEGGHAIALGGDITDLSLPERCVASVREQLGGLHVLVNNASIQQRGAWHEMSREDIQRQVEADFVSPILFCQHAFPLMREAGWGRIINIGSIQGRGGNAGMLPYAMSKAALENMTRGLARDVGKQGITVNLISPGYYNTYRNREDFPDEETKEKKGQWLPIPRIGEPEDCGGMAVLLCSEAGAYITGQIIGVDGGMSAR